MTTEAIPQAFAEESRELLEQAEDTLLELERAPQDPDLINALFRAVHTIKGSAGLFGLDEVVGFTHLAESVMGRIREGHMMLDDGLLNLFLQARDHISVLVESALAGETGLTPETRANGVALAAELSFHLDDKGENPPGPEPDPGADIPVAEGQRVASSTWHLSLRFNPAVLRDGMDPMSFFRYLSTIGDIVEIVTVDDGLPASDQLDAECCYLGFEIELRSETDKQTIESVFEFVQDDCELHILPPNSYVSEYIQVIESLPEENLRIGEILTLCGALTQRELQIALDQQTTLAQVVPTLGEIVVERNEVDQPIVDAALAKQQQVREQKAENLSSVRVNADKLESLINLVGEMVIAGANTSLLARNLGEPGLIEATENVARLVEEIRDTALGLRMVQIGDTFNRFRRVVRELSRDIGKDIELHLTGGDTELDKTVVEKISDPLMHLVRNALDHGLERPAERRAAGKPDKGNVYLNAHHDSGSIVIEVSDDGRGLARDKILTKALDNGLVKPNQNLTDGDVYRLIFEPGFSTAEQVTNISGRGVGMDVVRRNIDALRGLVDVSSEEGRGTKISIRLPLTLAIIDGFLVRIGPSAYVCSPP